MTNGLSLMVILLGEVYSGATRMAGYFELAKGQVFMERHEAYLRVDEGPLFGERRRGFQMHLDRLEVQRWDNEALLAQEAAYLL